jgi:hypothetical protein
VASDAVTGVVRAMRGRDVASVQHRMIRCMTLPPLPPQAPIAVGPYAAPALPRTNVLAIVAIVAGFMAPIAGIVTGHLALRQIARTGEEGRALALTGLITGYALTAFSLVFFIVWLTMMLSIVSMGIAAAN